MEKVNISFCERVAFSVTASVELLAKVELLNGTKLENRLFIYSCNK